MSSIFVVRAKRYRTIWISDVHLGTRGCKADLLLDFLKHNECETLYLVGDIVDGWRLRKSWYWPQTHNDLVQKVLRRARKGCRVVYVPGNHDEPEAMRRELAGRPFVLDPVFDLGNWRIVLLDSCIPGSAGGRLSPQSLARLDAGLGSAADRHALVCLHHHPVSMSSQWLDQVGLENAAEFLATIDRHRNVRAILWGHVHQNFDALRKGVRLLATPSTCAQFLPHSDTFAVDVRPPAYRTFELHSDGTLVTEVVWVDSFAAGSSSSVCSAA